MFLNIDLFQGNFGVFFRREVDSDTSILRIGNIPDFVNACSNPKLVVSVDRSLWKMFSIIIDMEYTTFFSGIINEGHSCSIAIVWAY